MGIIVDMNGRKRQLISDVSNNIDISNLESGSYFLIRLITKLKHIKLSLLFLNNQVSEKRKGCLFYISSLFYYSSSSTVLILCAT